MFVLLFGVGSNVGEFTYATFVRLPPAGAFVGARTTSVKFVPCPLVNVPKLQLTNPPTFAPPLTHVTPAGNASVTTTPPALDGPAFVTEIVYVRLLVASTPAGPLFSRKTSAKLVTVVTTGVFVLLFGVGSGVGELTYAMFVRLPPTGAFVGALTTSVRFVPWPFVSVPRLQFTSPLTFTPPLTHVTPAGNASVTVTLVAPDGPAFVTEIVYVRLLVASTPAGPILLTTKSADEVTPMKIVAVDVPPCPSEIV